MSIVSSKELGRKICKVFGFNSERVGSIVIDINAEKGIPTITVEQAITEEQGESLKVLFSEYGLTVVGGVEKKYRQTNSNL